MQGFLVSTTPAGSSKLELPRETCLLSFINGQACITPSQATQDSPSSAALEISWDNRSCTWSIQLINSAFSCRKNGKDLNKSKSRLTQNDTIQFDNFGSLVFHRTLDTPIWNNQPHEAIPLTPNKSLMIGRAYTASPDQATSSEDMSNKVLLDKDDFLISKNHAQIFMENKVWFLEDIGKTGTDLNGKLIMGKKELVYGDRFRISDYIFEFIGSHIKRIDHIVNGCLVARNLAVVVKDRVTGQPKRILDGISTRVESGEFIGILGGSGQGKSTFLDALCGIKPATEGTVEIGGISNLVLAQKNPGTIGYVPQDDIVHLELTVLDAFLYSGQLRLKLRKKELRSLIDRTIETLGLTEHREKRIRNLSGGQRKRVSIGIELLSKPSILFLDEPSSGLDPATEQSLMELLQSLSLNKLTVICTTHVLQNAFIFNRLFFIHAGKLIFAGNTEEARQFFLDQGASQSASRTFQSPLERIYSTVLNGHRTAEEWEQKFLQTHPPVDLSSEPPSQDTKTKKKQPSSIKKLFTLLKRQWSIMQSDKLNIAFLFAQVIIIGLLTAWVSDDLGLRTFLGLIAAMWFGCSNGAQQIVGELPILQRERVCGLGINVYIYSKLIFQGAVSAIQCLVLFAVITFAGNAFHPTDFDKEAFIESLKDRENPYILDESQQESQNDFLPVDDPMASDGDLDNIGSADQSGNLDDSLDNDEGETSLKTPPYADYLAWFAKNFHIKENILESGIQPLSLEDGTPIMGEDHIQKSTRGISAWKVVFITIGLRIGAFLLATLVGVCLGLLVSALVRTTTQAVMWVPLLLIPQILFGGFVISLPEMSPIVRKVAYFFPSNAAQRLVDVSHIYGRTTPSLSNRTKTPLFLTSDGKKETISWTEHGDEFTQDYQKISEVNTSWQNLAIRNNKLGEHKQAYNIAYGTHIKIPTDTVDARRDVRYEKGTCYQYLVPATRATIILVSWMIFCYIAIFIGLWKKKS